MQYENLFTETWAKTGMPVLAEPMDCGNMIYTFDGLIGIVLQTFLSVIEYH